MLPFRSVALICGSVPLSVDVAFSLQKSAELVGQAVAGAGRVSATGRTCWVSTPPMVMLSSHHPSSLAVVDQPGPLSKYEDWLGSMKPHDSPIQRMRTLAPRNGFRLNPLCTQTPFPVGSTTPGPAQSTTTADVVACGWQQFDQAPC